MNCSEQLRPGAQFAAPTFDLRQQALPWWSRGIGHALRRIPLRCPGKCSFARWALGSVLSRSDVIIEALSGDRFLVPQLSEPIAFHLFVNGIYEPATDAYLRTVLEAGDVFVDVGANIGVFALRAARLVGDEGRVLAIEASPNVFPYLIKNIELSELTNVNAIHCAASDHRDERLPFWEAPRSKFGMGALVPQFEEAPRFVLCRTLDDLLGLAGIKHVSVLKVDVEGAEADVFRGALCCLGSSPSPVIIFEFCDWAEARVPGRRPGDSQRVLMDLGYEIWRLEDLQLGGGSLSEPLAEGFEMLVAMRTSTRKSNQCANQLEL